MDNPIRILNLEDNAYDATLIAIELKKEYFSVDIKVATNKTDFEKLLNSYSFDVILADHNLPDYNGIDALQYAKTIFPDLPYIFVSGVLGEEKAILGMRYGASDYVDKNHLEKLGYALRRVLNETIARKQLIDLNNAIVESEERLRYVVKASGNMVWDMDLLTGIIHWNLGGQNQFGYLSHQIENTFEWWSQRLHPDEKKSILAGFDAILKSKDEIWKDEYRFTNGEGGYTWVLDSCCVLRDNTGKAYRAIGSMKDISALHKAQDDLMASKQLIEKSEKLKSSLLDNINHELRTPLNGILGFSDLLLEHVEKPETRIMVENILNSGRRLLNTVNSIMDVAQLSSGKFNVNLKLADLTVETGECIEKFAKLAEEKKIILLKNLDDAVIANIDTTGLHKTLDHLLNNAIKFTLTGWIEISTSYLKSGKPTITIKDTGIGISKDKQELIFQEFRQASEGMGRSYQGSGLGLTIIKNFMELMGGEIKLESEPGVGSTFSLIFPQVEASGNVINIGDPEEEALITEIHEMITDEFNVLIVEDDQINAELTSYYLEGVAAVDVAYNGESAIQMAKQKNYAAILMDINLGNGMSGFEATKVIRQLDNYKDAHIIATTGYTLYDEIELIKHSGFNEYLPKPFSRQELLTSIKKKFMINQV
jgi:PAS domain S-box-containing protein